MVIKCVIVEDERIAREGLQSYIDKYDFLELAGSFSNATDALHFIKAHEVDLLFLDIELPGMKGIEMAMQLEAVLPLVIFTTAYAQYALEGYKVNAVDYLVKPIFPEEFHKAVLKARNFFDYLEKDNTPVPVKELVVKSDGEWIKIHPAEILFLKSMQNYVLIYLENAKPRMVLQTLKEIAALFPPFFVQPHRSYLVNLNAVKKAGDDHLIIAGHTIPISRSRKKAVHRFFLENNQL